MKFELPDPISFRTNRSTFIFMDLSLEFELLLFWNRKSWFLEHLASYFSCREDDFRNPDEELQIHRMTFKNHCLMWILWFSMIINDFQWRSVYKMYTLIHCMHCKCCIQCIHVYNVCNVYYVYKVYNVYNVCNVHIVYTVYIQNYWKSLKAMKSTSYNDYWK